MMYLSEDSGDSMVKAATRDAREARYLVADLILYNLESPLRDSSEGIPDAKAASLAVRFQEYRGTLRRSPSFVLEDLWERRVDFWQKYAERRFLGAYEQLDRLNELAQRHVKRSQLVGYRLRETREFVKVWKNLLVREAQESRDCQAKLEGLLIEKRGDAKQLQKLCKCAFKNLDRKLRSIVNKTLPEDLVKAAKEAQALAKDVEHLSKRLSEQGVKEESCFKDGKANIEFVANGLKLAYEKARETVEEWQHIVEARIKRDFAKAEKALEDAKYDCNRINVKFTSELVVGDLDRLGEFHRQLKNSLNGVTSNLGTLKKSVFTMRELLGIDDRNTNSSLREVVSQIASTLESLHNNVRQTNRTLEGNAQLVRHLLGDGKEESKLSFRFTVGDEAVLQAVEDLLLQLRGEEPDNARRDLPSLVELARETKGRVNEWHKQCEEIDGALQKLDELELIDRNTSLRGWVEYLQGLEKIVASDEPAGFFALPNWRELLDQQQWPVLRKGMQALEETLKDGKERLMKGRSILDQREEIPDYVIKNYRWNSELDGSTTYSEVYSKIESAVKSTEEMIAYVEEKSKGFQEYAESIYQFIIKVATPGEVGESHWFRRLVRKFWKGASRSQRVWGGADLRKYKCALKAFDVYRKYKFVYEDTTCKGARE